MYLQPNLGMSELFKLEQQLVFVQFIAITFTYSGLICSHSSASRLQGMNLVNQQPAGDIEPRGSI